MTSLVLWEQLKQTGLVTGDCPAGATEQETPWYVRAMLGAAGWIGALFLLGFVYLLLHRDIDTPSTCALLGCLLIGGAYGLLKIAENSDFRAQFALASSFAGQALLWQAIFSAYNSHDESARWLLAAAIEGVLAIALPSAVHRVWSGYALAMCLAISLMVSPQAHFLANVLLSAAVGGVWLLQPKLPKPASIVQPVAVGLTLALLQVEGSMLYTQSWSYPSQDPEQIAFRLLLGSALNALILILVAAQLIRQTGHRWTEPKARIALLGAVLFGALSLKAAGVSSALMILLLGRAQANRFLIGIGVAAGLFYLSNYYYLLSTTLLVKSALLAGLGAALLTARWWIRHA